MRQTFYCDECAKKRGYPIRLRKDYGPCELCGKNRACNDVPSKELPRPKKKGESRYKDVRCRTCGALIHRYDKTHWIGGKVRARVIFADIRHHYKTQHPRKFRESIRKGIQSRKK